VNICIARACNAAFLGLLGRTVMLLVLHHSMAHMRMRHNDACEGLQVALLKSRVRQAPSLQRCSCKSLHSRRQHGCTLIQQGGVSGGSAGPGRPEGGEALALRALWRFLHDRYYHDGAARPS
jgi:hypothetical protein